ncbi:MCM2/3/5 family protein (macronuclear) [Tetrahymena thermophila SB210]|uniref:MCM2/3/5 family protein n=1 Tax=Tetrahymena thermophila (strain SB210) TaxID=312017 RepID=Q23YR0_TETTS|nr:MCM2/3/5 family protein [Tetrahymena thermophila SB210]EAS01662.2 MCM2/3/5 family protein [Tetrahymena thermophila SB210]|eukprot:XP_001021907.2 MCM2/3/5 family protein [Tetrahymena thermophila SB210]
MSFQNKNKPNTSSSFFNNNSFFRGIKIDEATQLNLSISQIPSQMGQSCMLSQDLFLSQKPQDKSKNKDFKQMQSDSSKISFTKDLTSSFVSNSNNNAFSIKIDASSIDEQLSSGDYQKVKEFVYYFQNLLVCKDHKNSFVQIDDNIVQINLEELLFNQKCQNSTCLEICKKQLKISSIYSFNKLMYHSLKIALNSVFSKNLKPDFSKLKFQLKVSQNLQNSEGESIYKAKHNDLVFLQGFFESYLDSNIYFSYVQRRYTIVHSYKFIVNDENQTCLTVFTLEKEVKDKIDLFQDVNLIGFLVIITNPFSQLNEFTIEINQINQIKENNTQDCLENQLKMIQEVRELQQQKSCFDSMVKNFFKNVLPQNFVFKGLLLLILVSNTSKLTDLNILFLCDNGLSQTDLLKQLQLFQKQNYKIVSEQENRANKQQRNTIIQKKVNAKNNCFMNSSSQPKKVYLNCHKQNSDVLRRNLKYKFHSVIMKGQIDKLSEYHQINMLFSNCCFSSYNQNLTISENCLPLGSSLLQELQYICRIRDCVDEDFIQKKINAQLNRKILSKRKLNDYNCDEYFQDSISSRINLQGECSYQDDNFYQNYFEFLKQVPTPQFNQNSSELVRQAFINFQVVNKFQENLHFLTQNPKIVPFIIELSKARAKIDFCEIVKEEHIQDVIDLLIEGFQEISQEAELVFQQDDEEQQLMQENNEEVTGRKIKRCGKQKQVMIYLNFLKERGSTFNRRELRQYFEECGIQITGCFDDFIDELNYNDYLKQITQTQFQLNLDKL